MLGEIQGPSGMVTGVPFCIVQGLLPETLSPHKSYQVIYENMKSRALSSQSQDGQPSFLLQAVQPVEPLSSVPLCLWCLRYYVLHFLGSSSQEVWDGGSPVRRLHPGKAK